MEADVLWKAAMRPRLSTGLGKRPPNHHPRFPHLPQPLLQEKEGVGGTKTKTTFVKSVTYVPGLTCYLCSRSYTEGRMRGRLLSRQPCTDTPFHRLTLARTPP